MVISKIIDVNLPRERDLNYLFDCEKFCIEMGHHRRCSNSVSGPIQCAKIDVLDNSSYTTIFVIFTICYLARAYLSHRT